MSAMNNCPVDFFVPVMYGTAAFSIIFSIVVLVLNHTLRERLNGFRRAMPFRLSSMLLLQKFVYVALGLQAYFLLSTVLQIDSERPVCVNGPDLIYLLAWADWFAIVLFSIWPAVLLAVLLHNVWLEAKGRGKIQIVQPGEDSK